MRAAFPLAPDEADNDVCEDGTACHWLANEVWDGRFPQEGTLSPNNRVITEEMFDAVDMYHDVLRGWADVAPVCEKQVPIPSVMQGMVGTPDAWAYNPTKKRLYIADLKFGYRFVEVWDNWQLICYVSGLIDLLQLNDQEVTVEMTIVQPRSNHRNGPVRTWRVRASDLRGHVNQLANAAIVATQEAPECVPNPGCRDCPGRHACDALQNAALTAIETAYAGVPLELPAPALGNELRLLKDAAKKLDARITGLETQADQMLRKGEVIPGWVLAPTFARESWREGTENEIITIGQLMGKSVAKPIKPITPAQARKVLPANLVAIYAHKPSTGVKLVPQDPYEARKAFEQ
jgi:Protein of unknown function (DUF2800).